VKIIASRLFLIILVISCLSGPSFAEVTYTHHITPFAPIYSGDYVTDSVASSWASETNNYGSMKFEWSQKQRAQASFSECVGYDLIGNYEYESSYPVMEAGTWKIFYTEFDSIYGNGDIIGGGEPQDYVTFTALEAPEFSSFTYVTMLLFCTYFILRKKLD